MKLRNIRINKLVKTILLLAIIFSCRKLNPNDQEKEKRNIKYHFDYIKMINHYQAEAFDSVGDSCTEIQSATESKKVYDCKRYQKVYTRKDTNYGTYVLVEYRFEKLKRIKKLSFRFIENKIESIDSSNHCYGFGNAEKDHDRKARYMYVICGRYFGIYSNKNESDYQCTHTHQKLNPKDIPLMGTDCGDQFQGKDGVVQYSSNRGACNNNCLEILPFLYTGKYISRKENVLIRDEPSRKGKVISILSKDKEIEVVEDTGPIEEIDFNIAPWVKVKLADGNIGYVFGALIRKEFDFWP